LVVRNLHLHKPFTWDFIPCAENQKNSPEARKVYGFGLNSGFLPLPILFAFHTQKPLNPDSKLQLSGKQRPHPETQPRTISSAMGGIIRPVGTRVTSTA